ncbi:DUF2523 family protein [Aquirhabdus parva]|uniref:DUF2523 domain-containing protein n=1 Tax=Aquirhabdus parva TaxID=2283318 RepID=A0A345P703_9GAMM|nr:DUF2523 family protein [Aquirhabdus parva]AXI03062.1 DUF2523 domain-containing protein [Aquirhabdus parva]
MGIQSLFRKALDSSGDGLIKRVLTGAGLSLASSAVIMTLVTYALGQMQASLSGAGDVAALIGVSGLDQGLSVIMGALIARATMSSTGISIRKSS